MWPKEKEKAPLKWSHHQPKAHTLPKNNMKALILKNMTKVKITHKKVLTHQVKPKVKFSPPCKFKNKNKLKTTVGAKTGGSRVGGPELCV